MPGKMPCGAEVGELSPRHTLTVAPLLLSLHPHFTSVWKSGSAYSKNEVLSRSWERREDRYFCVFLGGGAQLPKKRKLVTSLLSRHLAPTPYLPTSRNPCFPAAPVLCWGPAAGNESQRQRAGGQLGLSGWEAHHPHPQLL